MIIFGLIIVIANSCYEKYSIDPALKGTVADIDSNVYNTVKIGTQIWMAENLKVTKYRNGDSIPNIIDNAEWGKLQIGAYCDHNNKEKYAAAFGRLYNWYAVNDQRNIAPIGWHVPTDVEWETLINFHDDDNDEAGIKLMETGEDHWRNSSVYGTNKYGFTAIPSGFRNEIGKFDGWKEYAYWWSSVESSNTKSIYFSIFSVSIYCIVGGGPEEKNKGMSIRCIKDN
jgi:uncharacterized protein (TIGR02145 family)